MYKVKRTPGSSYCKDRANPGRGYRSGMKLAILELWLVLVFVFFFTASSGPVFSESPSSSPSTRNFPALSASIGTLAEDEMLSAGTELSSWNADGSIRCLQGKLSEPLAGDLASAAIAFVKDRAALFNPPRKTGDADLAIVMTVQTHGKNVDRSSQQGDGNLSLIKTVQTYGGTHFTFQMTHAGARVIGAYVKVNTRSDRRVCLVTNSLPTIARMTNRVCLSASEAIELASAIVPPSDRFGDAVSADLVVFPKDGQGFWAYAISLFSEESLGCWEILIDADSGKELGCVNYMRSAEATGKGSVYERNPLVAGPTLQPLPHLTAHTLEGLYAKIVNDAVFPSLNPDDSHVYNPDDIHFDEVNAYFFTNRAHDFFQTLGFQGFEKPLRVIVNYKRDPDAGSACWNPTKGAFLIFGKGDRFNDPVREDDILYHEYTHVVFWTICSPYITGSETNAIKEGTADYFGASLANCHRIGEWVFAKQPEVIRDLENSLHYPEDLAGECHKDGRIWSGALWDLRGSLGKEIVDRLVLSAIPYFHNDSTFFDGYNAMILADRELNAGCNEGTITKVFQKRGLTTPSTEITVVSNRDVKKMRIFRALHD